MSAERNQAAAHIKRLHGQGWTRAELHGEALKLVADLRLEDTADQLLARALPSTLHGFGVVYAGASDAHHPCCPCWDCAGVRAPLGPSDDLRSFDECVRDDRGRS